MTQRIISPVNLGDTGLRFVKTELASGDELATSALRQLPIDDGTAITYLPANIDLERLDLKRGPVWPQDVANVDLWSPAIDLVIRFLVIDSERVILCENFGKMIVAATSSGTIDRDFLYQ